MKWSWRKAIGLPSIEPGISPEAINDAARTIAAARRSGANGEELERIIGFYKTAYPEKWDAMRLGPACDAIDQMIAELKG